MQERVREFVAQHDLDAPPEYRLLALADSLEIDEALTKSDSRITETGDAGSP